MKLSSFFVIVFIAFSTVSFSQTTDKQILLTIDDEPVYLDEFLRVYEKNLDMVQDQSQKSKKSYLDLFVNYKLKTKEAFKQELHKQTSFIKELNSYKDQLAQNYLYEQKITEELILEGYERLQEEVSANHILIRVTRDARPKDTLAAYNKIKNLLQRARGGEDFVELAKKYSEEPNADERGGSLGYFKGFGMVYPFESAAYNTPVGEVSDIIRTQYGYHILKVNDRRDVPEEVTVAHIMISIKDGDADEDSKNRLEDILKRARQGEDFGDLARQFSEDPGTSKNGGKLNRFGSGRLNAPNFEQAAFDLENPGDVTNPVKTDFGWHIIQLIERHPVETFEASRDELLRRVKSSDRSKVVIASVNERIKEKYNFEVIENPLPFFNSFVTDSILKRKWENPGNHAKLNTTAFRIGDINYTFGDFANYIEARQKRSRVYQARDLQLQDYYKEFEDEKLDEFYKISLELENPEYSNLVSEYRNGLLIYDLMQNTIWEPSKADTIGMKQFFDNNKDSYTWKTRIDGLIASTADKKIANQIKKMFTENASEEEIKNKFNTDDVVHVILTQGVYEMENSILPSNFKASKGVSKVYEVSTNSSTNSAQYIVVKVENVIPQSYKNLDEVRGKVMSDYQSYLEQKWMEELHKKYEVKINKSLIN